MSDMDLSSTLRFAPPNLGATKGSFQPPPIKAPPDCVSAATGVTNAVLRGEMTPHEGRAVSSMLELQVKAIDYADIARQIVELKELLKEQGITVSGR